jgi:hypothetical protein
LRVFSFSSCDSCVEVVKGGNSYVDLMVALIPAVPIVPLFTIVGLVPSVVLTFVVVSALAFGGMYVDDWVVTPGTSGFLPSDYGIDCNIL